MFTTFEKDSRPRVPRALPVMLAVGVFALAGVGLTLRGAAEAAAIPPPVLDEGAGSQGPKVAALERLFPKLYRKAPGRPHAMCYHVYMKSRRRLGVRAMRQNLSTYLRRVGSGEAFEVTARGRPVAVLAPIEAGSTPVDRLVASGRASRPEGDLLELGPPPTGGRSRPLSQALQEERAGRF